MPEESDPPLSDRESRYRTRLSVRNSTSTSSTLSKDSVPTVKIFNKNQSRSKSRGRKKTIYPLVRSERKQSEILDVVGIDEKNKVRHFDRREHKMDPYISFKERRFSATVPLLVGIGILIVIIVPLTKFFGGVKKDIDLLRTELIGMRKHFKYVDPYLTESTKLIQAKRLPKETTKAVKSIIQEELITYDSDRTGKTDFALESAGGSIVKTVNTKDYAASTTLFGFVVCEGTNGPRAIIQAGSAPGECWAFKGPKGTVIIKLLGRVYIDSVSLEHIPKNMSPTGTVDTAPKEFSVYGLPQINAKTHEKTLLGHFVYDANGPPIQMYQVLTGCKSCKVSFQYVEFQVRSNQGSPDFTCVYRFRVHGILDKIDK